MNEVKVFHITIWYFCDIIFAMGNPLVLIVSNKEERVRLFSSWLPEYDVSYATTVEEAVNIFSNNYLKIRVVLLDLVLPDYSGIDALIRMKSISKLSEVIMISDQFDIERAVDCIKKGAFDFLLYPFPKAKLLQTMIQAIENINFLAYDTDDWGDVNKEFRDRISFLNDVVKQNKLYERSVSGQELYDLICLGKGSLNEIQENAHDLIKKSFHSFNLPKILLVEDEDLYRNLIKAFLHQLFDVIVASNGKEAREILSREKHIDVVVLDLFLPDDSGVDLMTVVQRQHPESEIVIVTAYEQISEATKLIRLGAENFLNKPVLRDQLINVIFRAMEKKYSQKIIPYVKKKLIDYELSDEDKYRLLRDLVRSRKDDQKPVLMKDLYHYFPELKQLCLPDSLSISGIDLQKGIEDFVHDLRGSLAQQTALMHVEH